MDRESIPNRIGFTSGWMLLCPAIAATFVALSIAISSWFVIGTLIAVGFGAYFLVRTLQLRRKYYYGYGADGREIRGVQSDATSERGANGHDGGGGERNEHPADQGERKRPEQPDSAD